MFVAHVGSGILEGARAASCTGGDDACTAPVGSLPPSLQKWYFTSGTVAIDTFRLERAFKLEGTRFDHSSVFGARAAWNGYQHIGLTGNKKVDMYAKQAIEEGLDRLSSDGKTDYFDKPNESGMYSLDSNKPSELCISCFADHNLDVNTDCGITQDQSNLCTKLQLKKSDGGILMLNIQNLSADLMESFLDFKMNYYVKEEIGHKIAGISEDPEAVREYREIISDILSHPSYITRVYMSDKEYHSHSKIVAASMIKLIKSIEDVDDNIKAETKAVKRYIDILSIYNKLFGIEDIMKKYNINHYYEDLGMIVHPEYRKLGICYFEAEARRLMCKEHNIPLTGAWCTSGFAQKVCEKGNWDTAFEISYNKLGSLLGVDIQGVPSTCKYMAIKVQ
ncbi:uncharacterized protein LOC131842645 [Achroia grisella]|uniref:uncharacterized protein LOC131842645 n=1 Tax=Achroia grisella TaxID=688607 RepID=UPI0027D24C5A|nr:uncharacterized protein LOC131842645 [Achroia grisella]